MSTTAVNLTLVDVAAFIGSASPEDVDAVLDLARDRAKALRAIATRVTAASVQKGTDVVLAGLNPKYLNGLTGTVESVRGARVDVSLDVESSDRLRFTRQTRFNVLPGARYTLHGVPMATITVTPAPSTA